MNTQSLRTLLVVMFGGGSLFCLSGLKMALASGFKLSMLQIVVPLCGFFFSAPLALSFFLSYVVIRSLVSGMLFLPFFTTWGLPTALSTVYLSLDTKKSPLLDALLRVGVPLLCIAIFMLHPVGSKAGLYSFYWLIPFALYGIERIIKLGESSLFFARALSSTFLAHMAGSIIYLYAFNLTVEQWLALIPVVFVERFIIAGALTVGWVIIGYSIKMSRVSDRKRVQLFD